MPSENQFLERRITAEDGLQLYVRDYAARKTTRTPVVCLGGITRNSKDFHRLALHLCDSRRVIAPDYRGRGQSGYDPDWANYEPQTYLNDLRHILISLNIHRAVFIGTSLGGLLTAGFSVLAPTMVAGAVLNDIGPHVGGDAFSGIVDYMGADVVHPDMPAAIAYLQTQFPDIDANDEATWAELAENVMRRDAEGRVRPDWDPSIAKPFQGRSGPLIPDLWPLFKALGRVPVLALRGGKSKLLSAETFRQMEHEIPGIKCVTEPDAGHPVDLMSPDILAEVDALLARIQ